jgi:hypothetical protein
MSQSVSHGIRVFFALTAILGSISVSACGGLVLVAVDDAGSQDPLVPAEAAVPTAAVPTATSECWKASPRDPTGPSGRIGSCSVVGTWKYEAAFNSGRLSAGLDQSPMVWAFDDEGRAIGGPDGTKQCSAWPWSATYTLGGGRLDVRDVQGARAPSCSWGRGAGTGLNIDFSANCRTATLSVATDSCTGGALFYTGNMTRID